MPLTLTRPPKRVKAKVEFIDDDNDNAPRDRRASSRNNRRVRQAYSRGRTTPLQLRGASARVRLTHPTPVAVVPCPAPVRTIGRPPEAGPRSLGLPPVAGPAV